MKIVRCCGAAAKCISEIADALNGSATAPKAIMVMGTMFAITSDAPDPQLIRHELEHVYTAAEMEPWFIPKLGPLRKLREWWGWKRFYSLYSLFNAKHGYWENPFEVRARIASGEELPPLRNADKCGDCGASTCWYMDMAERMRMVKK